MLLLASLAVAAQEESAPDPAEGSSPNTPDTEKVEGSSAFSIEPSCNHRRAIHRWPACQHPCRHLPDISFQVEVAVG
jgi:hypothetical protein